MYRLNYFYFSDKTLCHFDSYQDCKSAMEVLKRKYPNSKIWMDKVNTVSSLEEFNDIFSGRISDYDIH